MRVFAERPAQGGKLLPDQWQEITGLRLALSSRSERSIPEQKDTPMDLQLLIDPDSAGFVLAGTIVATLARSGLEDCRQTAAQLARLARKPFNLPQHRAELARPVEAMRQDGVIRSEAAPLSDREFSDATAALVRHRSTDALMDEHRRHASERATKRQQAISTLGDAGELAPVLGLAGTLLALSQLPATGLSNEGAVMASVGTAVVSTFYGLLAAHLLFLPLAGAISRRGRREERDREALARWLVDKLEPACPSKTSARGIAA